jgi:hypothetical protein
MLNLNYNINNALGGGGCIGVTKFNYSASIEATAGGGGGSDYLGTFPGGGGGAGAGYSTSISIIPNLTYQINVGGGGAANSKGQNTTFFGFDDNDTNPISLLLEGGFPGTPDNGGNSGTGSYTTVLGTTNLNSFSGSIRTSSTVQGNTFFLAGGGAGRNGNGVPPVLQFKSGDGGPGGGGGGGAARQASTFAVAGFGDGGGGNGGGTNGNATAGVNGGGGGGASTPGGGVVPAAGGNGVVTISYSGEPKAFVTNATTVTADGITTHTFASGSGTFLYTYPYPWPDVVPYQVEVCPEQRNGFAPYIYPDPYSGSIVSAIPGAVFKQGFDNLFGMDNIWDDISSYVRGTGVPIGSDRTITPQGTGTIVSASATPWDRYGYPNSLLIPSNSLLNAGTDSGTFEGFNIPSASYSPSGSNFNWAAECWVAVPISSSFVLPNRSIVRKENSYNLNLFSGTNDTALVWQNNAQSKYTGPLTASLTMNVINPTGSDPLIYQANGTMGTSGSNVMTSFEWHHIAFSSEYFQCDPISPTGTHTIYRGFFDGREIFAAPINMCGFVERIPKYPSRQPANPALIFGDLFGETEGLMQDFRFYKGTNKNYTASFDVNDVYPIVIARPY